MSFSVRSRRMTVLKGHAALAARRRVASRLTPSAVAAMRKPMRIDRPDFSLMQRLAAAGIGTCPVSGMPVFDPSRCSDALLQAIWVAYCNVATAVKFSRSDDTCGALRALQALQLELHNQALAHKLPDHTDEEPSGDADAIGPPSKRSCRSNRVVHDDVNVSDESELDDVAPSTASEATHDISGGSPAVVALEATPPPPPPPPSPQSSTDRGEPCSTTDAVSVGLDPRTRPSMNQPADSESELCQRARTADPAAHVALPHQSSQRGGEKEMDVCRARPTATWETEVIRPSFLALRQAVDSVHALCGGGDMALNGASATSARAAARGRDTHASRMLQAASRPSPSTDPSVSAPAATCSPSVRGRNASLLAHLNPLPGDPHLAFDEAFHSYQVGGSTVERSVTSLVGALFDDAFDPDNYISQNFARWAQDPRSKYHQAIQETRQRGGTDDEAAAAIRDCWAALGKEAAQLGTALHLYLELLANRVHSAVPHKLRTEVGQFEAFARSDFVCRTGLQPYRTELTVAWREPGRAVSAGQIDLLYRARNGLVTMVDFKRIASKHALVPWARAFGGAYGAPPVDELPNTPFWRYSLQLS